MTALSAGWMFRGPVANTLDVRSRGCACRTTNPSFPSQANPTRLVEQRRASVKAKLDDARATRSGVRSAGSVDHPGHAELVGEGAIVGRPEGGGERHGDLAAFGQAIEPAAGGFDIVSVQADIEAVLRLVDIGGQSVSMSAPISAWSPISSQQCISQSLYWGPTGMSGGPSP